MSGYCNKCGNTICICNEVKKFKLKKKQQKTLIINNCAECPYSQEDSWQERRYCLLTESGKIIDNYPFPTWCPLV
jgi:hypothetical protein